MNSERRKRLAKICEQLEEIQVEIQAIADEEQECYDNLPESLQYAERGERMKAIEIQGAAEIDVDFDQELKRLVKAGSLLKSEGESVEKILMRNDPDDGVQGGATLWKLTQAITAHARELKPRRSRELHEISGALLNRVKVTA